MNIGSCYVAVFYLLNFTHHCPLQFFLGAHISYFLFCMQKSFPFPTFRMQQLKEIADYDLHAALEDVTNKNCLSLY